MDAGAAPETAASPVQSNLMSIDPPVVNETLETGAPEPPRPVRDPAWSLWDVFLVVVVFVIAFAVSLLLAAVVLRLVPSYESLKMGQALTRQPLFFVPVQALAYLLTFLFAKMLITLRAQQHFGIAIHWAPQHGANACGFLFAGAMLSLLILLASSILPIPKGLPIEQSYRTPLAAWMMLAFGILLAPLVEEIFFRGILFPVLARDLGVVAGIVLTALAFAYLHQGQLAGAWAPLVLLFIVGVMFTTVRHRTGSVAASWLMHVGYNGMLFGTMLWMTDGFRHLERLAQ